MQTTVALKVLRLWKLGSGNSRKPTWQIFSQLVDVLNPQKPLNHTDYTYDHLESVKTCSYEVQLRAKTYARNVLQAGNHFIFCSKFCA
ncbi:hypothetical protein DD238_002583 [Peronospora effusa]|uniref:Uncharacterized protein n=1 Tax=Peronospora effusa TaxID=542832 RepID=A0A3M6VFY8_9STRA|nr:hypothetical protein DD238_002583 [Peronospora effusa]